MRRIVVLLVLTLVCCACMIHADSGIVADWDFSEGSGTVLHDRSSNGNDGQITGAKWVKSGSMSALEFDGEDDCVDCGAGPSLDLHGPLSIEVWVCPETHHWPGEPGIAGKSMRSYGITQYGSSAWAYIATSSGGANGALSMGVWNHVVASYDGKTNRLYINGAQVSAPPAAAALGTGGHFWIGRIDGEYTMGVRFHGRIAEVRVYNRALSAQEAGLLSMSKRVSDSAKATPVCISSRKKMLVKMDAFGIGQPFDRLRVDIALLKEGRTTPVSQTSANKFTADGKALVDLHIPALQPGQYDLRITPCDTKGRDLGVSSVIRIDWPEVTRYPVGPPEARRLNNLVTELLNVPKPDSSGKKYTFENPRNGWVYFSNRASTELSLKAAGADTATSVQLKYAYGDAHEDMLLLPAGMYAVSALAVDHLIIRAVPHLVFAEYGNNPLVPEFGSYQGEFQKKYVLPNVNTMVASGGQIANEQSRSLHDQGKRLLESCSVPTGTADKPPAVEEAVKFILQQPGFTESDFSGLIADEFSNSQTHCALWARAVDQVLSDPKHKGMMYVPYGANFWTGEPGREFMDVLVKRDCFLAWKRYLWEQPTETEAWYFMGDMLVNGMNGFRQHCPGSLPHLVVCFGYFSLPQENLTTYPYINYKAYLETQYNLVATDPAFDGLGGLMSYLASYGDEEMVRWCCRLFRHYGIEGRTDVLRNEPYLLPHLKNQDFEEQGKGWALSPAEDGGITFGSYPSFSWLQGRWPGTTAGNTVLITTRSEKRPNTFSQEVRNLKPGRSYSFRMVSADFKDMSVKQKQAVSVRLDGVTLIPEKCFTAVTPNDYSHTTAEYDSKRKAWMNYHLRVFRANGKTARLTVSDWADDKTPGGPIGEKLMYNFVVVQPYEAD